MASPQKEDGFTPIANDIMEALARTRIPGEARSVLDVILRKTYGWNKKEDFISLTQFVDLTGLHRATVVRSLKRLIDMGVVAKVLLPSSKYATTLSARYTFQKDYEKWRVVAPVLLGSSKTPKKVVAPVLPTKEIIQKKHTLSNFDHFWTEYPKKVGKGAAQKAWEKVKPTNGTLEAILKALSWQKRSDQWTKDGGQFIPNPSTYLNQRRWEDEPIRIHEAKRLPL